MPTVSSSVWKSSGATGGRVLMLSTSWLVGRRLCACCGSSHCRPTGFWMHWLAVHQQSAQALLQNVKPNVAAAILICAQTLPGVLGTRSMQVEQKYSVHACCTDAHLCSCMLNLYAPLYWRSLSSRPGVIVKQVSGLLATTRCMDRSMDGKHGWRWTKVCAKQALRKSCGTSLLQMWPCPSVSLRRERCDTTSQPGINKADFFRS